LRRVGEEKLTDVNEAAGEGLPPSKLLTGRSLAPALGLRAGSTGFVILMQTGS
jgi:hypothetical protein